MRPLATALASALLGPPAAAPGFDPGALADIGGHEPHMRVEPRRDGSYLYRDTDRGFRAVIHADGSVEYLPSLADLRVTFLGFDLLPRRSRSEQPPSADSAPGVAAPRGAGDPTHDPNSYGAVPILIGVGGRLPGVADLVQRGEHLAAKGRFLDDSASLREALAAQTDQRRTRERLGSLDAELSAIWQDSSAKRSRVRAELFQRWDECAEKIPSARSQSPEDARRTRAGELGRRQIEAFVRAHAPAGGPLAYSTTELARLNATRRSLQAFEPYAAADPDAGRAPTIRD